MSILVKGNVTTKNKWQYVCKLFRTRSILQSLSFIFNAVVLGDYKFCPYCFSMSLHKQQSFFGYDTTCKDCGGEYYTSYY
jgi:hypothetical protein